MEFQPIQFYRERSLLPFVITISLLVIVINLASLKTENYLIGIPIVSIITFLMFCARGLQIDTNTMHYRKAISWAGVATSGKWRTLESNYKIQLCSVRKSNALMGRGNHHGTYSKAFSEIYLLDIDRKEKQFIKSGKQQDIQLFAIELATYLDLELVRR